MTEALAVRPAGLVEQPQADSDEQLVALWLHGRPAHTRRAYGADVDRFQCFLGVDLRRVRLLDLQAYADSLSASAPTTQARRLSAVKSLLSFGARIGYLPVNVGAALRLPRLRNDLAERILSEDQVQRLLAFADDRRDRALLRLAYASGARVSEIVGLRWRDLAERADAGQATLFGKGAKTRAVLLTPRTWREVVALRDGAGPDAPVFGTRNGRPLHPSQVWRIVRRAAGRAGIGAPVSPHWMRHAHASHAMDRGAPLHLVQATLGHASAATTSRYLHARPSDSSSRYLAV